MSSEPQNVEPIPIMGNLIELLGRIPDLKEQDQDYLSTVFHVLEIQKMPDEKKTFF